MCKESHRKLAESIWGMLLDFSVALFKGALLDGSTSRFASQVSARRKTGVRKPLSWDWRHPQHNTLMFRYLAIAVFIFVVFLFTLLSGWTWHCPLRRSCTAVCGRTHTHTHTQSYPPERDQRCYAVNPENKSVSCSPVSMLIPQYLF